ncbi:S-layer homology domain-containing protein [Paenibacillus sp. CGMCC 1.16610]|uniref:S-layer homology domain-containing protein n=1 Tax=Paenibacillus TaxID=44249 RepID=UPI0012F82B10|nr:MULTISPECIES: S-layer homology domain-containing protein [Paenibacillus]MBA2943751.1 S-layer homology domain-containing protein [Paenibacillus sp. CGMCC 1.16610]
MRKKSLFIYLCIVLTLITANAETHTAIAKTSADYKDLIGLDEKTKAKVDKWLNEGLIQGISEERFGVNETITRAEFAKIVALSVGITINNTLKISSFNDVRSDDPVYGDKLSFIEALRESGITDGIEIDHFNPSGLVTKEQFAVFLIRAQGKDAEGKQTQAGSDETVSNYAKGYVALALKLFPYLRSEGSFYGSIPITRQMVLLGLDDLTVSYCGCRNSEGDRLR